MYYIYIFLICMCDNNENILRTIFFNDYDNCFASTQKYPNKQIVKNTNHINRIKKGFN